MSEVQNSANSFLQSKGWEEFQRALGHEVWRADGALVTKREMPLGLNWLYVPRGVVSEKAFKEILELGREQESVFARIEPVKQLPESVYKRVAEIDEHVQPQHTLVVDLQKSEDELLADMHKKTRYNIGLAERKGVTVRFSRDVSDVDLFLKIAREVEERGQFHFHPDEYYRKMIAVLQGEVFAELAIAEHEGDVLAAFMLVGYGDTVTYLHGASSSRKRNLMAPHLLQWESIKRAKDAGSLQYDFWGVSAEGAGSDDSWAGITRFKEGFGGSRVHYPGTYEIVLRPVWHGVYKLAKHMN